MNAEQGELVKGEDAGNGEHPAGTADNDADPGSKKEAGGLQPPQNADGAGGEPGNADDYGQQVGWIG